MKKFLLTAFIFITLNIVIVMAFTLYLSYKIEKRGFTNAQTESNLLFLKTNRHYGLTFLGISHARNLSRHNNHERIEKILNKKICNLAQGWDADGIHVQYLYLKYFYEQGNTSDTVVFFTSPVMFYADYLDFNPLSYFLEPFKFSFAWLNIKEGCSNRWEQLFYYIRGKFSPYWLDMKPSVNDTIETAALTDIDTAAVHAGLKEAYRNGMAPQVFKDKCNELKKVIELAQTHHSKVILIIPPALFGKWPGTDETVDFLKQLQPVYRTPCYNFTDSVKDPSMYYDHHHLNTKGVVYFTQKDLKPILGR